MEWANATSESSMQGEGSIWARWRTSVDCPGGRPDTGAMVAVPPAFASVPHNLVFLHMSLACPEILAFC